MTEPTEALLAALRDASDGLRDAWLFDETAYTALFVRSDVEDRIADVAVERYVDNERYGYVTRETYESLHYTEYRYTVRAFDEFVQYRTFLTAADGDRVGLMASFDPDAEPDYRALTDQLVETAADSFVSLDDS